MGIFSWIFFGLIVGIIAKFLLPGKDGGGIIMTCVLGIAGSFVGGWFSTLIGYGRTDIYNAPGIIMSIIGAMVVLFVYRKLK
jgi:uncharacterized membrane protein YeaQ/YmgE (transglycosylase-associated protein family)